MDVKRSIRFKLLSPHTRLATPADRDPWADAHGYMLSPLRGYFRATARGDFATRKTQRPPAGFSLAKLDQLATILHRRSTFPWTPKQPFQKDSAMKRIVEVVRDAPKHWVGDGFPVRSLFSYQPDPAAYSPFLLLDYAEPHEFAPAGQTRGVGEHPHRGFETVTIVYQGEVDHRDSSGNSGSIGPGDVQWMTAAGGILHEEFHSPSFTKTGGTFEVVQLWVNLPAREKMTPPRYQDLRADAIPTVELDGEAGTARIIAGDFNGTRGPARTVTSINVWDLDVPANRRIELPIPEGQTAVLLVRDGSVQINDSEQLSNGQLALFDRRDTCILVETLGPTTALLLSGEPIDEPVVGRGPFVMNTQEEISEAIRDFQSGRFGAMS